MLKVIKIKTIKKHDLPSIKRMIESLSRFHGDYIVVKKDFLKTAFLEENISFGYIIYKKDKPIGFSIGYDWFNFVHNTKHHHIDLFFIEAKQRGKKYGSLLLSHVIKKAQERKCFVIDVTASPYNKNAQQFYKSYGFFIRNKVSKQFRLTIG